MPPHECAIRQEYLRSVSTKLNAKMHPFSQGGPSDQNVNWYLQRWGMLTMVYARACNRTGLPLPAGTVAADADPGSRFCPKARAYYHARLDADLQATISSKPR